MNNKLTPTSQAISARAASAEDTAVAAWLFSKSQLSHSAKTQAAYSETIAGFRATLSGSGMDLLGDPAAIAWHAERYLGTSLTGKPLAPLTRRQRRAILSSFYTFCLRRGLYPTNPILLTEMPRGEAEHAAHAFAPADIGARLGAIDTRNLPGERDYLLLSLALVTTRRAGEIARLTWGDIREEAGQTVAHFLCKGAKRMKDALTPAMVASLDLYRARLATALSARHVPLTEATPVFPSFANSNYGGPMSTAALGQIAKRHTGESRFHALRHTGAQALQDAHVNVSDIQGQLGHGSLKVTGEYLKAHRALAPTHGALLERAFGIGPQEGEK